MCQEDSDDNSSHISAEDIINRRKQNTIKMILGEGLPKE